MSNLVGRVARPLFVDAGCWAKVWKTGRRTTYRMCGHKPSPGKLTCNRHILLEGEAQALKAKEEETADHYHV